MITHRWLYRQARLLEPGLVTSYLKRLDDMDDPVREAQASTRCPDCGIPAVLGVCTALCRCDRCRQERPFVQLSFAWTRSK